MGGVPGVLTWLNWFKRLVVVGEVKGIPPWRDWKNTNLYCLTGTVLFESTWRTLQRDTSVWSTIQPARFQHVLSSQVRGGFNNEGLFSTCTSSGRLDYLVLQGQTGQSGLAVWDKCIYQGYCRRIFLNFGDVLDFRGTCALELPKVKAKGAFIKKQSTKLCNCTT